MVIIRLQKSLYYKTLFKIIWGAEQSSRYLHRVVSIGQAVYCSPVTSSSRSPPIVFNVPLFTKHWPSTNTQNHSILVIMMHSNFLSACLLYVQGLVSVNIVFVLLERQIAFV